MLFDTHFAEQDLGQWRNKTSLLYKSFDILFFPTATTKKWVSRKEMHLCTVNNCCGIFEIEYKGYKG